MTTDGGLRQLFRDHLRRGFHWQSVETVLVSQGVPDSNYCARNPKIFGDLMEDPLPGSGREGWVEYKQTDGYAVTLRPEQIGWLTRRALTGGRVFVAVRRWHDGGTRRGEPVDELWLCAGGRARELKADGLRAGRGILGVWGGGPARWDWGAVRELLLR